MASRLIEIFEDEKLVQKTKERLPYLFQLAELESSRAGRIGMQVGSLREKIIIALLIYKFGEEKVETEIPITEPEVDVRLFGAPVSIKTITGLGGIKVSWTVDAQKAGEFLRGYVPGCDILLVQINWDREGGFYYLPVEVQGRVFKEMGRDRYLKLPKPGTNPRGVEISKDGLLKLISDEGVQKIGIMWQRSRISYGPYKRWVDYWKE